jgi:hypothetical protein
MTAYLLARAESRRGRAEIRRATEILRAELATAPEALHGSLEQAANLLAGAAFLGASANVRK